MDPSTVEALLRIRINGPKLEHWTWHDYVHAWINSGHYLTDDILYSNKPSKNANQLHDESIGESELDGIYYSTSQIY